MPHERQFTELVRHVHSITHDKLVGAQESLKISFDMGCQMARLVQQYRRIGRSGAACGQQILCEGEGASRFENIVNQQHIAALPRRIASTTRRASP